MRRLARHYDENEELWSLAGLLHDLDYDQTVNDFARHGFVTAEMLSGIGVDERIIAAIKGHPGHIERESLMAKALFAVDPITGLIVAAALMHPTKKLAHLDTDFILRRFKEKRFAAGANREQIETCKEIGLTLEEFIQLCLEAMHGIAPDLGL